MIGASSLLVYMAAFISRELYTTRRMSVAPESPLLPWIRITFDSKVSKDAAQPVPGYTLLKSYPDRPDLDDEGSPRTVHVGCIEPTTGTCDLESLSIAHECRHLSGVQSSWLQLGLTTLSLQFHLMDNLDLRAIRVYLFPLCLVSPDAVG